MEETKTCPKCGWVYPITTPRTTCRFCGAWFEKGFCSICGQYVKQMHGTKCDACFQKQVRSLYINEDYRIWKGISILRKRAVTDKQLQEWLDMINKIPKPLRTLTEEEWFNACNYFRECALCGKEEIEARAFFIPFSMGGRYAEWNVIPICEHCATRLRRKQKNPYEIYQDRVSKITAYLRPIIERSIVDEKDIQI